MEKILFFVVIGFGLCFGAPRRPSGTWQVATAEELAERDETLKQILDEIDIDISESHDTPITRQMLADAAIKRQKKPMMSPTSGRRRVQIGGFSNDDSSSDPVGVGVAEEEQGPEPVDGLKRLLSGALDAAEPAQHIDAAKNFVYGTLAGIGLKNAIPSMSFGELNGDFNLGNVFDTKIIDRAIGADGTGKLIDTEKLTQLLDQLKKFEELLKGVFGDQRRVETPFS